MTTSNGTAARVNGAKAGKPKDLAHHLAYRVRHQPPSAMKAYGALADSRPGLTSLAGASLFPLQHATFTVPSFSSLNGDTASVADGSGATSELHLDKSGTGPGPAGLMDLRTVLQYGLTKSYPQIVDKLLSLNKLLHGTPHSEQAVTLTLGNTDGISKALSLFIEEGDIILAEEFTFPATVNSSRSKGATVFPVTLDRKGIVPEALDDVLSNWDETRGKKPHVLVVIPCGQNPTGSVPTYERLDAVYAVAQKHDLVIIEDDPYYPLQYTEYEPDAARRATALAAARAALPPLPSTPGEDDVEEVARVFRDHAGIQSYLSRDVDGRVVRLDSFSKVFGPGVRLGWASASQQLVERLWRVGEVTTQTPNNLAQALLASYLSDPAEVPGSDPGEPGSLQGGWGLSGWLRWVHAVRLSYQSKRDFFLDAFKENVPLDLVSTTPAMGGMFQWLRIDLAKTPRYDGSNARELIDELAERLLDEGVLVLPARLFLVGEPSEDKQLAAFRATFAGDEATIEKGLKLFGSGVRRWFEENSSAGGAANGNGHAHAHAHAKENGKSNGNGEAKRNGSANGNGKAA